MCPCAVLSRRALKQQTDPLAAYAAVDCNVSLSVGLDSFSTGLSAATATGTAMLAKTLAGFGIEVSSSASYTQTALAASAGP